MFCMVLALLHFAVKQGACRLIVCTQAQLKHTSVAVQANAHLLMVLQKYTQHTQLIRLAVDSLQTLTPVKMQLPAIPGISHCCTIYCWPSAQLAVQHDHQTQPCRKPCILGLHVRFLQQQIKSVTAVFTCTNSACPA